MSAAQSKQFNSLNKVLAKFNGGDGGMVRQAHYIKNILSSTDLRLLIRALSLSKGGDGGMVRQAHHIKNILSSTDLRLLIRALSLSKGCAFWLKSLPAAGRRTFFDENPEIEF